MILTRLFLFITRKRLGGAGGIPQAALLDSEDNPLFDSGDNKLFAIDS